MKLKLFLIFSLLFLLTLENYGKAQLIIALLISFLIPVIYDRVAFRYSLLIKCYAAFMFIVLIPLLAYVSHTPFKVNIYNYDYFDFVLSSIAKFYISAVLVFLLRTEGKLFFDAINGVLGVHITVFFIQFIVSHIFGFYLDLLYPITGEHQRYESLMSLPIVGQLYRCTGLYNEPSLYASFIFCLMFLRLYFSSDYKLGNIGFFAVLSIFLTFSLAPIIILLVFLFVYIFSNVQNVILKTCVTASILISMYPLYLLGIERIGATTFSPIEIRVNLVKQVFSQSASELFFGNGPLGVPEDLAQYTWGESMLDNQLASFPDAGAWLFMIMKFGILFLLLYTFFMLFRIQGTVNKIVLLLVLLTKMNFLYAFFIAFSFLIFYGNKKSFSTKAGNL